MEADIDESTPPSMRASEAVTMTALRKAQEVARRVDDDCVIIAADTMVVFDGNRLGKPDDESDAFAMLNMLSGMWHEVMTGVAVICGDRVITACETARVKFRDITEEEIDAYIASKEPMDKAGAYGAQGLGSIFVERIEGDFYNVMGLPLYRLSEMLGEIGMHPLDQYRH